MKRLIITNFSKYMLIIIITMITLTFSCVHEPLVPQDPNSQNPDPDPEPDPDGEACDPNVVYFQNDVLPILVSNCAKSGCHNSTTAEEDIVLDSYTNVMGSDIIMPGDAGDSDLYERITDDDSDDVMPPPPHQRLTPDQISKIRLWIQQGADNTVCSKSGCDTTNVTYAGSVRPLITNKCVGCHSGNTPSGGLNFTTQAGLQVPAQDGRLLGAISHAAGFTPMPQGGAKLSSCEINMIKVWIDAGAPNN